MAQWWRTCGEVLAQMSANSLLRANLGHTESMHKKTQNSYNLHTRKAGFAYHI